MLQITLNAHEVGRITNALFLMEEDSGDSIARELRELRELREGIIEAWVAQNPEHVDDPWCSAIAETKGVKCACLTCLDMACSVCADMKGR